MAVSRLRSAACSLLAAFLAASAAPLSGFAISRRHDGRKWEPVGGARGCVELWRGGTFESFQVCEAETETLDPYPKQEINLRINPKAGRTAVFSSTPAGHRDNTDPVSLGAADAATPTPAIMTMVMTPLLQPASPAVLRSCGGRTRRGTTRRVRVPTRVLAASSPSSHSSDGDGGANLADKVATLVGVGLCVGAMAASLTLLPPLASAAAGDRPPPVGLADCARHVVDSHCQPSFLS